MTDSTIKEDFLEVDQSIPGQNYVCLSFVSPEEVLENKQVFFVHAFLETMGKNYGLSREECQEKYKDFLYVNQEKLEKDFYERNDFRTTVRGLKVRGVYDTLKEAQVRSQVLQRKDPNFNVFIGQVGYWLPWDPHPHKIDKQEYQEQQLNELVHKYKENQEKKEQHFQENIDYVKEQAAKQAEKQKKINAQYNEENQQSIASTSGTSDSDGVIVNNQVDNSTEELKNSLEAEDPWLASKNRNGSE